MTGLGLINYIQANTDNNFDIVPVDIISNSILITSAYAAREKGCLHIYNQGTSQVNPLTFLNFKENLLNYAKNFDFNKKIFPINVEVI